MTRKSQTLPRIAMVATTLLLSLAFLFLVLESVCFCRPWFMYEYSSRNDITEWIDTDIAVEVTNEMMRYCYGRRDNLDDIKATVRGAGYPDGQELAFFNQREKHHLADCRELFVLSHKLAIIFLVVSAVLVAFIAKKIRGLSAYTSLYALPYTSEHASEHIVVRRYSVFATVFRNTVIGITGITAVAAVIFALNFDKAYDWVHELLFDNYLWILNPATDNLIRLMQTDIIVETALLVGAVWITAMLLLALIITKLSGSHIFTQEG